MLVTGHQTYHHYIGNGLFDSNIDVVILVNPPNNCKLSRNRYGSLVNYPTATLYCPINLFRTIPRSFGMST